HQHTGQWPRADSGVIAEADFDTWSAVNQALRVGVRGLPGGSSLARLLEEQRGVRNRKHLAPLTVRRILQWAEAHYRRSGRWPNSQSGSIPEAPGETWRRVDGALRNGARGHRGGSS